MTKYQQHFPALRRLGVVFRPVVWSAEGRAHPATVRLFDNMVRLFSNKHGKAEAVGFRCRFLHEVGVAIQRRKAAMIRAALPRLSKRQRWMQGMDSGGVTCADAGRLPSIEDDLVEEKDDARW